MNAHGQVSLWSGDPKGKGSSWDACLGAGTAWPALCCPAGCSPNTPAWGPGQGPSPSLGAADPKSWCEAELQRDGAVPGSHRHHVPQHHSAAARGPGCQRCISLFHNHYQGLLSGAGAAAGVPGWLRYRERTTIAQGLPPTGTKARPRSQPNLPLPLPTGRGWLKLGSLLLLSSSGHSVSGTSHWILGVQAQVLLATVS